jgi:hypothetical protein
MSKTLIRLGLSAKKWGIPNIVFLSNKHTRLKIILLVDKILNY